MQGKANIYLLLSTLFFSSMQALVKDLSHIPIYQLIFFRASISFVICLIDLKDKNIPFFGNNKTLLIARGVFGVVSLSGFYYSLHHIPLAIAISVTNLRPIIILFLGSIFLNEKVKPVIWVFFIISFFGVVLMSSFDARITAAEMSLLVFATVVSCFSAIAVRKLKATDHPLVVVFYFSLITLPVCTPFAIYYWVTPYDYLDWLKLVGVGLCTHFAQYFMTKGFHISKFKGMASFSYLGLFFAFLFGYLFFGENYSMYVYIGMAVVLTGLFGTFFFKD